MREFAVGVSFIRAPQPRARNLLVGAPSAPHLRLRQPKRDCPKPCLRGGVVVDGDASRIVRNVVVRSPWSASVAADSGRRQRRRSLSQGRHLSFRGDNNTVCRNRVRGRPRWALGRSSTARGLLKRNVAVGAEDDGFAVRTRRTKLTRNRALRNGDLGIGALGGVIDGGGNRAHGNGNPAQCRNVACK